jgi:hypothetical protein
MSLAAEEAGEDEGGEEKFGSERFLVASSAFFSEANKFWISFDSVSLKIGVWLGLVTAVFRDASFTCGPPDNLMAKIPIAAAPPTMRTKIHPLGDESAGSERNTRGARPTRPTTRAMSRSSVIVLSVELGISLAGISRPTNFSAKSTAIDAKIIRSRLSASIPVIVRTPRQERKDNCRNDARRLPISAELELRFSVCYRQLAIRKAKPLEPPEHRSPACAPNGHVVRCCFDFSGVQLRLAHRLQVYVPQRFACR